MKLNFHRKIIYLRKALLITALTFLPLQPLWAQITDLEASEITGENGKNLHRAMGVFQDTTGLIWISEWNPVNMDFDGALLSYNGFRTARAGFQTGLESGNQKVVGQSEQGFLYSVGDSLCVLNPYQRTVEAVYKFKDYNASISGGKIVYAFGEYPSSLYAIIAQTDYQNTDDYVLAKVDSGGDLQVLQSFNCTSNVFFKLATLTNDGLYILDQNRIRLLNENLELIRVYAPELSDGFELKSIYKNDEGDLCVLAASELDHNLAGNKEKFSVYLKKRSDADFKKIKLPSEAESRNEVRLALFGSEVWLMGSDFYLARYNFRNESYEYFTERLKKELTDFDFFFLKSQFYNLFQDGSGAYWLSSMEGLIKFSLLPQELKVYLKQDITCIGGKCSIRGLCTDKDDNIYISYQNGIKILANNDRRLIDLPLDSVHLSAGGFFSLSQIGDNLFWSDKILNLKTGKVKTILPDKKNSRVIHYLDTVKEQIWLMEDKNYTDLYVYSLKDTTLKSIKVNLKHLAETEIHQIYARKAQNQVIILTGEKFVLLDSKGELIRDFKKDILPESSTVIGSNCFKVIDDRYLWVANHSSKTIFRIDLESFAIDYQISIAEYQEARDLIFYSMTFGNKNEIWFGLNSGLGYLDIGREEFKIRDDLPVVNGLEFNRPSALKDKAGILWFGSINGLVSFDPKQLKEETGQEQKPRVVYSKYDYYDGRENKWHRSNLLSNGKKEIRLAHYQNSIRIDFFYPDYKTSEKIRFSHWLEGLEPDYSIPRRISSLDYANLDPGEYILHLRGGLDAVSCEASESLLRIHVAQAWYKTTLAFILYFLSFAGLIYGLYRFQKKRLKEQEDAKYLRQLDKFKSDFFTNITHEFRTPLTVILGLAEEIKSEVEIKHQISRNGRRLLQLINQILDLSKLEEGKLSLESKPIDIVKFTKYISSSFISLAKAKQIEVEFNSGVSALTVMSDEEKYRAILSNLLSNAIKFSPEKSKISITIEQKGKCLILRVQDQGQGIPDDELEKVFDRFYQVEGNKKFRIGSGVGLALSKEYIKLMNGSIKARNSDEGGAIFEVMLPLKTNEDILVEKEFRQDDYFIEKGFTQSNDFIPENHDNQNIVLLVEDEPDVLSYLRICLQDQFQIVEAHNGREGIEKAFEFIPDLIISDVMMPELDGLEMTQVLKEHVKTSHIPLIILSAKASLGSRLEGLKRGAEVYLSKPFEKEELLLHVHNLFKLRAKIQSYYKKDNPLSQAENVDIQDHEFIIKLKDHLENNLENESFGIQQLCELENLNRSQLHRKLKALTSMSASEFVNSYRLQRSKEFLKSADMNISEVAYAVGYSDPAYYSRLFQKTFNQSPKQYKDSIFGKH